MKKLYQLLFKKKELFFLIAFIVFGSFTTTRRSTKNAAPPKPNIIIIMADDLGWGDVGFLGSYIHTPHIDKLAKEGVILDQFYTAPIGAPTRAGLMTGRYPDRFGLRRASIAPWSKFGVDTSEVFLPEMLAKAGYENRAAIGKWGLGHAYKRYLPLNRGFTHFYGCYNRSVGYFNHKKLGELDWHDDFATCYDKGYATSLITREAVNSIKEYSHRSPFFLYVAYTAPHSPLIARKKDLLQYGFDKNKPFFNGKKVRKPIVRGNTKRQTYAAMVTRMDKGIGEILEVLKNQRIEDNTVVLFLSDNGPAPKGGGSSGKLRGHKNQEWNGGVRVPAVIRWPEELEASGKTKQLMGYVDVMPTLLAIAGIKAQSEKKFDGMNMLPVLRGNKQQIDRSFYLGNGAIINYPWKLVKAHSGNRRMKMKSDALFNLAKDPEEKQNVRKQYPEIYKQLSKTVKAYDKIIPAQKSPHYNKGKQGFIAPKNWTIKKF